MVPPPNRFPLRSKSNTVVPTSASNCLYELRSNYNENLFGSVFVDNNVKRIIIFIIVDLLRACQFIYSWGIYIIGSYIIGSFWLPLVTLSYHRLVDDCKDFEVSGVFFVELYP